MKHLPAPRPEGCSPREQVSPGALEVAAHPPLPKATLLGASWSRAGKDELSEAISPPQAMSNVSYVLLD